jgi:hypothetical protein
MDSKDIDDYPGGGIETTEVPLEDPLVTATTISVTTIARIPSPIGRRPDLAWRPDAQRTSTDPAATETAPKISANEGIQMVNKKAKGANAGPRVVACPIPSHRERRVEAAIPNDGTAGCFRRTGLPGCTRD